MVKPTPEDIERAKRSLIGTMVGDSLGLPYEKLPSNRTTRLLPFPLRQRLWFGHGFASDDTAQSVFVIQSLIESDYSEAEFRRRLAGKLRIWFLAIPPGIGLSTIKACLKLCVGLGPDRSGVNSAGNGAAMRVAALGAVFASDAEARIRFVEASTTITHTSLLAKQGAQLIALAAAKNAAGQISMFDAEAESLCPNWPWQTEQPHNGPSGYVVHSVNAAIRIWKACGQDPQKAIELVVLAGGDTDTVGAMVGGILGSSNHCEWPHPWVKVIGWPNRAEIESIGIRGRRLQYWRMVSSHVLALPAILGFGIRRLLPPY